MHPGAENDHHLAAHSTQLYEYMEGLVTICAKGIWEVSFSYKHEVTANLDPLRNSGWKWYGPARFSNSQNTVEMV